VTAAAAGLGAFLALAALVALFTGLYVVVTGRRSWALIPGRRAGAIVLAASLVAFGGGIALADSPEIDSTVAESPAPTPSTSTVPTPTPEATASAEFTEDAPIDPPTPVAAPEATEVVLADTSATQSTALALLATLPIKGKAAKTGYDRSGMFGTAWLDVDRNGCDTRNDILARDLTAIVKSGQCRVLTGNLVSPFTGTAISFLRGTATSAQVQIDHVVSLSNSWQTGAQQLTEAQRISFANDPINLLAVDGSSNASKGAGDTATWLPPNKSFRCAYVARQVSVKATYGLWVTQAEHDAMARVLATCPSEPAVTSSFTPAPVAVAPPAPVAPAPKPAPAPAPAPVAPAPAPAPVAPPSSVYYANCAAVRAAGAAPLYAGQPGYETPRLDRDGDGVACE
jgi:outer membrane biosynthesis protein TonB